MYSKSAHVWAVIIAGTVVAVYGVYLILHVFSRYELPAVMGFVFCIAIFAGIAYSSFHATGDAEKKVDKQED